MAKRNKHPYEKLNIGIVEQYSKIVPRSELQQWLDKGWLEAPGYAGFLYEAEDHETMLLGIPQRLTDGGPERLIGAEIVDFGANYGTYGMGGPGFFGLTLVTPEGEERTLVYAVWESAEYILLDDRVLSCHPSHYGRFHPWLSDYANGDIPNWDELTGELIGAKIESAVVAEDTLSIRIRSRNQPRTLEYTKKDGRLPPMGNGNRRKAAFRQGVIGDYLLLVEDGTVLHV
ncbi:hypothetical protein SAMN04487970_1001296 [Paenibacillus tianmuensis]|uniref:Uncharacterized protein n=1 Tax=Paenibacillus tianmuensis TaxID=624147 RepID=A0A1G4P9F5_9BACL|nr:hypothetical protein [Paenibacillus tianmuensis]SCW28872.1 hypothetical protein SAMN04487970_1001296 [Paenibacillus tianmuensis]